MIIHDFIEGKIKAFWIECSNENTVGTRAWNLREIGRTKDINNFLRTFFQELIEKCGEEIIEQLAWNVEVPEWGDSDESKEKRRKRYSLTKNKLIEIVKDINREPERSHLKGKI